MDGLMDGWMDGLMDVLAPGPLAVLPAFGTTTDLAPGSVIRGDSALAFLGVSGYIACRRVLVSEAAHASDTLRRFLQPHGDGGGGGGLETPRDNRPGGQPLGGGATAPIGCCARELKPSPAPVAPFGVSARPPRGSCKIWSWGGSSSRSTPSDSTTSKTSSSVAPIE